MTVAAMLESISSVELTEWKALFLVRQEEQKEHEKEMERKSKKGGKK
jgi:hypothetical protein